MDLTFIFHLHFKVVEILKDFAFSLAPIAFT